MPKSSLTPIHEFDKQLLDQLNRESNRGISLIGAALLDEALRELLSVTIFACSSQEKNRLELQSKLFEDRGTLQTFSSKIEVSYLIGAIERDLYLALNQLRKIRNDFAHSIALDFEDASMKDRILGLSEQLYPKTTLKPKGAILNKLDYMLYQMAEKEKEQGTRNLFDFCIQSMYSQILHKIASVKFKPGEISNNIFEYLCSQF